MALPNVINEINTIKSTYLPKSGGTMTGVIRVPSFAIGKTGTNDSVHICAGTGYESGSLLRLDGNDHSTRPGEFSLWAGGTTYNKVLSGNINGNLTWCGSQIHTDATYSGVSFLKCNETLSYGWNGLQYFNKNMSASEEATQNVSPTADWYHIIRMNHANSNGYYVDLAACFHSDRLYTRRVAGGNGGTGWNEIPVLVHSWRYGVNGYRRYSDGYTEQWGRATINERQALTVNLHIAMGTSEYMVIPINFAGSTAADAEGALHISSTSTTSFVMTCGYINPNTSAMGWYVCGY
jgi:hypothetical protein